LLFLEFVLTLDFRNKTMRDNDINYYYCCAYNNIDIMFFFLHKIHTSTNIIHTCTSLHVSNYKYIPTNNYYLKMYHCDNNSFVGSLVVLNLVLMIPNSYNLYLQILKVLLKRFIGFQILTRSYTNKNYKNCIYLND